MTDQPYRARIAELERENAELQDAEASLVNVIAQQRDTLNGAGKAYASLERKLAQLEAKKLRERMTRARHVLTAGSPSPLCNWGMLDVSADVTDQAALDAYVAEQSSAAVEAAQEAIKERDKLGYAVVKLVGAVDELLAQSEECEGHDGFLAEIAPSGVWAELRSAAEDMTLRAEDFEAKHQALASALIPQPSTLDTDYVRKDKVRGMMLNVAGAIFAYAAPDACLPVDALSGVVDRILTEQGVK
jgi:DNA repair exonuclease SbcCD ATPase subunit